MRKTIITAVASAALAVPGIALASHQGEHQLRDDHGVHHKRHHAKHHHHAHIVTFGAAANSVPAAGSGSGSSTSTPTAPMPSSDETAGTIASFSNGTLTITLKDGSTVSGKVTSFTEIECRSAAAAASHGDQGDDNGQGDDNNEGDNRGRDDQSQGRASSDSGNGGQDDGPGHDEGDDNGQGECTTAALVPGAVVREAELSVSSAGSVWEKVELDA